MKPTTNQTAASRIRLNRVVIKEGYANFRILCRAVRRLFRSGAIPSGTGSETIQLGLKRGALEAEARGTVWTAERAVTLPKGAQNALTFLIATRLGLLRIELRLGM
jgi:hypothetical protein